MVILLSALLSTLCSMFRSRAALELEHIALRHQIGVLKRSARKRPKLTAADRMFWVFLSQVWGDWRSALDIVTPATANRLASQGILPFLDLEDPARTRRSSGSSAGRSQPHPQDELGEPDVGCAKNSRRTAQTRHGY